MGYKVAPSYISAGVYKTNAPIPVVYDVIKSWKMKNSEDKYLSNVKDESSLKILKKEIEQKPDFEFEGEKHKKVPRFISMGKNMGPKGKPESRVLNDEEIKGLEK